MGASNSTVDRFADYSQILSECYKEYNELPELDLGDRQGHTDYIDFLDVSEMTSPVMKFVDKFNRKGFALHLKCKWDEYKDRTNVLAIFQRYSNTDSVWTFGWGHSDCFMEDAYHAYHGPNHKGGIMVCDDCPQFRVSIGYELLRNILNNSDPVIELVNE